MCEIPWREYFWQKSEWPLFVFVQTKVTWRTLRITWYSRQRRGIKVQSCPVLR